MKALIHCSIWSNSIYFWHKGKRLTFDRLPRAREEALLLGYDGIRVTPDQVKPPRGAAQPLGRKHAK